MNKGNYSLLKETSLKYPYIIFAYVLASVGKHDPPPLSGLENGHDGV